MSTSNAMRRLLWIRELQEDQERANLEKALSEVESLKDAMMQARARTRQGRELLVRAAASYGIDRLVAIVELEAADRRVRNLVPCISAAESEVEDARQAYILRRRSRLQVETLMQEEDLREERVGTRIGQQTLDDWFGMRRHRVAQNHPDPKDAHEE